MDLDKERTLREDLQSEPVSVAHHCNRAGEVRGSYPPNSVPQAQGGGVSLTRTAEIIRVGDTMK